MKTIESIQIWNNGQVKTASVLDAKANVNLNKDANFNYYLYSLNNDGNISETLASGYIYMDSQIYSTWDQDEIAWDFVANSLNLNIIGDYIKPKLLPEPVESNPEIL